MSSWRGHMVVGAMVGYAGAVVIVGHPRTASEVGRTVGLMAASAVLATLPDLDTRHSIASRGARLILVIGMIALGGMLGYRGFVSHAGPHGAVMPFDLIVRPYGAAAVIAGVLGPMCTVPQKLAANI